MDWSKAKNILIVAFMITNIFLIYHVEKDVFHDSTLMVQNESKIQEIVSILEERGIIVETEVPREVLELPVLEVEYETYDKESIHEESYGKGQVSLTMNNKVLLYKNDSGKSYIDDLNEKKARHEAEKFLKKHGFLTSNVVHWNTKKNGDWYEVIFAQKYKGRLLEPSYMKCIVTESGIEEFERMWLKPLKLGENKKAIIPSTKALLKLLDMIEGTETITITRINLVYWLDFSQISFTNWENIQSGTAIPAWRIELESGDIQFIPAFEDY